MRSSCRGNYRRSISPLNAIPRWDGTIFIVMNNASNSHLRIFLTGATGVIGRRVIPLLIADGHQVTAVGRSETKRALLQRLGATPVALDLFDASAARQAMEGHDVLINMATHIPQSTFQIMLPWSWRENDRIRREGSATLARAATDAGVQLMIQESFAPIYEDGGETWIDETFPVRPVRYNRTVLDAEHSAAEFTRRGGRGVVLRFAGFYGPDSSHVPEMIRSVRTGWSPLPGDPNAFFSSVSHDDAATAVVAALGVPAGIYNVVDDEPLRRGELVNSLADAIGAKPPKPLPTWITRLGGSLMELFMRSQRMSNKKLRGATGWAPRFRSIREGWPWAITQTPAATPARPNA